MSSVVGGEARKEEGDNTDKGVGLWEGGKPNGYLN
jgi:hypothetical protein